MYSCTAQLIFLQTTVFKVAGFHIPPYPPSSARTIKALVSVLLRRFRKFVEVKLPLNTKQNIV